MVIFICYTKLTFVSALPNFIAAPSKPLTFILNSYFKMTVKSFFPLSTSILWVLVFKLTMPMGKIRRNWDFFLGVFGVCIWLLPHLNLRNGSMMPHVYWLFLYHFQIINKFKIFCGKKRVKQIYVGKCYYIQLLFCVGPWTAPNCNYFVFRHMFVLSIHFWIILNRLWTGKTSEFLGDTLWCGKF